MNEEQRDELDRLLEEVGKAGHNDAVLYSKESLDELEKTKANVIGFIFKLIEEN